MTWHYPNPQHPSSQASPRANDIRQHPCPTCSAPAGAQCITKTGRRYDGNHKDRARAWAGAR